MMRWYADPAAWRLIGLRYLPWFAGLSLACEIAQLPLYTVWAIGSAAFIAYSVVHCTIGDAIIGAVTLALALVVTGARELRHWRWLRLAAVTALAGAAYTVFSEWANTTARFWTYSQAMPVVHMGTFQIGLSPLAQWLILPPLVLRIVHPASDGRREGETAGSQPSRN